MLKIIREAALWVFSLLFEVSDVESALAKAILDRVPAPAPEPDGTFDKAIDGLYGIVEVGDQNYYASELLFAVDHDAYKDLGARLCSVGDEDEGDGEC